MNERFSFPDLFIKPVEAEKGKAVILDKIVIPKIQRPYAQGRSDGVSTFVRNSFLEEIFTHLTSGEIADLNFVYGIIRPDDKGHIMELLDGQQRLTTLFLVYWYVINRELEAGSDEDERLRSCLRKFSYETRSTSTYFCQKLADFHVSVEDMSPKAAITQAKWYFKSFDRDSTICAMLTMLDAIHERYNQGGCHGLITNLDKLQFYVKSLGYFHLSEELYIKMNARGLQLSAFENFKADLTNFITKSSYGPFSDLVSLYREGATEKIPFSQNFSIKLDAKWVDLFWRQGSEDFDSSYMSFFSRFFAYKYILDSADTISDRDMRQDPGIKELYTDAEPRIQRNEYFGFRPYQNCLDPHPEYITSLSTVLDTLYEYDFRDNRRIISREFTPVWERDGKDSIDDFLYNSKTRFSHNKLILLSAVMEFITAYKTFSPEVYQEWMRVVSNVIENTNIDSLTPVSSLIRKFSELIQSVVKKDSHSTIESFYHGFSLFPLKENENRAVEEEVKKARIITENIRWLPVFKNAECHHYFKGMVLFFYREDMTLEQYENGYRRISTMFDKDGITTPFKEKHMLLRAIVSNFCSWKDLDQQYITERAETNKYLKNILSSHAGVRSMFASLALLSEETDINEALQSILDNAAPAIPWGDARPEEIIRLNLAVNNLRTNVPLYDYFTSKERDKHFFRIYWFLGLIMLAVKDTTYDRIALDTNRAEVANDLSKLHGFIFCDENQKQVIEQYGVCFGKEIWLTRRINDVLFWVKFCTEHMVHLLLEFPSMEQAGDYAQFFEGSVPTDSFLKLASLVDYPNDSLIKSILEVFDKAEKTLSELKRNDDEQDLMS